MDLRREYPAGRAARRDGRGDHHPPVPIGQVDGLDDAVIGQVEDRARSIPLRTSILVHRLVVLWNVDVLTTPITAGPRAVLRQRRDAPHHHEPGRASYAAPLPSGQPEVNGSVDDDGVNTDLDDTKDTGVGDPEIEEAGATAPPAPPPPSPYSYIWVPVSEFSGCGADTSDGTAWSCTPHPDSCEAGNGSGFTGIGDALVVG